MFVCARCTTHVLWAAEVCPGCGLTLHAPISEPVAVAPAAPSAPITYEPVPDNPWRNEDEAEAPVTTPAPAVAPAPIMAAYPAPIEEATPVAEAAPAPVPAPVPTYTPPPLGTPIALTFADPLPPLPEPTAPVEYAAVAVAGTAPDTVASTAPAIPVKAPEAEDTAPRVAVADDDLGVPAAYAPFAPEPTAEVASPAAAAPAEVVELIPATGLTIAPPAVETPGWPAAAGEAAH
jgi:hypothetical protein